MSQNFQRAIIYIKDVMRLQGCSYRTAQRKIREIRRQNNKGPRDQVTRWELSQYMKIQDDNLKGLD